MSRQNMIFAQEIRVGSLNVFKHRGFGHIGGAMSIVETLAVLYNGVLRVRPQDPGWNERDRLVMSKGHASVSLYTALSIKGFFPEDMLETLNIPGTRLPSHCDMNLTPGIDMSTGSLGQGASCAVGIALGQRMSGMDARTYLLLGDGECNEGQVWEALMLAAHKKLHNLIIFCDRNSQQLDGYCKDVLDTHDLAEKFRSFGCFTQVIDGHDTDGIADAIKAAHNQPEAPSMIVLNTKKGKGCNFAEDQEFNHHYALTEDMIDNAIAKAEEHLEHLRRESS